MKLKATKVPYSSIVGTVTDEITLAYRALGPLLPMYVVEDAKPIPSALRDVLRKAYLKRAALNEAITQAEFALAKTGPRP